MKSWDWAKGLGRASDEAMTQTRSLRNEIWPGSEAQWESQRFTTKVRTWAQVILGLTWVLIVLAVVLVAIGFFRAVAERSNPQPLSATPTLSFVRTVLRD
jgi:negative regulator of sigma E activity